MHERIVMGGGAHSVTLPVFCELPQLQASELKLGCGRLIISANQDDQ